MMMYNKNKNRPSLHIQKCSHKPFLAWLNEIRLVVLLGSKWAQGWRKYEEGYTNHIYYSLGDEGAIITDMDRRSALTVRGGALGVSGNFGVSKTMAIVLMGWVLYLTVAIKYKR